jgi:hypothetical protein
MIFLFIFFNFIEIGYSYKRLYCASNIRLQCANNMYGCDNRYNITNNLPIKKLKLANPEPSFMSIDEEKTIARIAINMNKLKLLNQLNQNISEIEKITAIESSKVFTNNLCVNIFAGGLLDDWHK